MVFATLGGVLPVPPLPAGADVDDVDARIRIAIEAQEAAGLEPITDGGLRHRDPMAALAAALDGVEVRDGAPPVVRGSLQWRAPILVEAWQFAASCTDRAVKQAIVGPYTLARHLAPGRLGRAGVTLALAEAISAELQALAAAGCPLIEVVEDAAISIGDDPAERRLFRDAHARLTAAVDGVHLSLAIRGGSADGAGSDTILAAPYASYLFDLRAGPDNWRLVGDVPGDRGVIVGADDATVARPESVEILTFAIGYAASSGGRGHDRVGVATSGDMTGLSWAAGQAKMAGIGRMVELYAGPPGSLAAAMDPRAVDIRSAAMGRREPPPDRAAKP